MMISRRVTPSRDFSALSASERRHPDAPSCLVLDVRLPGLSGLDLQRELADADPPMQIVFITAHGDVPMTVKAMKAGAVESNSSTPSSMRLIATARHDSNGRNWPSCDKQIAADLRTSEATVKAHRAQLMRKMKAESVAQ
jgi:FixJ family two-component response regulator